MNILDLTEKDLFEMKLKDIPIEIVYDECSSQWCSDDALAHLYEIGVIEKRDKHSIIKHRIRFWIEREVAPRQYRRNFDEDLEVGDILGGK